MLTDSIKLLKDSLAHLDKTKFTAKQQDNINTVDKEIKYVIAQLEHTQKDLVNEAKAEAGKVLLKDLKDEDLIMELAKRLDAPLGQYFAAQG